MVEESHDQKCPWDVVFFIFQFDAEGHQDRCHNGG